MPNGTFNPDYRCLYLTRRLFIPQSPGFSNLSYRHAPWLRRVRLRDQRRQIYRHVHGPHAFGRPPRRDSFWVRRRLAHLPLHQLSWAALTARRRSSRDHRRGRNPERRERVEEPHGHDELRGHRRPRGEG